MQAEETPKGLCWKMNLKPRIDEFTAALNMQEQQTPFKTHEALAEAERCLFCFDAPCITTCPTGIDIPGFIKKITTGNISGASKTIYRSNPLGGSCARACPTNVLCEGACVLKQPIKIGKLQRYVTDSAMENNLPVYTSPSIKTGKKIALIGAGPASLACAATLAQLGHDTVIYEKKKWPGGLNTFGVAYYKMTPQFSLQEIQMIEKMGVKIHLNTEVGKEVSSAELQEKFDALFIGIGLGQGRPLNIPGDLLPGLVDALDFIESFHANPLEDTPMGKHVAVIGGGNTAMDCAVQAKKLAAETVTVFYRQGEADMPAYRHEYEWAQKNGCRFIFNVCPIKILGEHQVTGILLRDKSTEETLTFPCDMVIKAVGQQNLNLRKLFPDLEILENGKTSRPEIFAGGDLVNGGKEVVHAVGEGLKAAMGLHEFLTGTKINPPFQATRSGSGAGLFEPLRPLERDVVCNA